MVTKKRNTIYYEFWKDNSYVKTGFKTLNNVSITTGIDTVPTMTLQIPITELPKKTASSPVTEVYETNFARYEIRVYIKYEGTTKYAFFGIVDDIEIDFAGFCATLNLSHRIARMREWIMPSNYTVKNSDFDFVIGPEGCQLGSSSTVNNAQSYDMDIDIDVIVEEMPKLEMTFSSTTKLAALTEACENTLKLHWIVDLSDNEQDRIIVSEFGELKDAVISVSPIVNEDCDNTSSERYVTMLTEPTYTADYTDHFNRAVVFCGDVGEGVLHMTLKAVYEDQSLWIDGFPVGMYENELNLNNETAYASESATESEECEVSKINNERVYANNEALVLANNDNREYYVTDTETLEEFDDGVIRQTVYNFSDLYPIPSLSGTDENCEEVEYMITDEDRIEITKRAYQRAVRKLRYQRPSHTWQFNCTTLPTYVTDGDKITFMYSKKMYPHFSDEIDGECLDLSSEQPTEVFTIKEDLYVTKRIITFDSVLNEYNTLTLDTELRERDLSPIELELREKIDEPTDDSSTSTSTSHITLGESNTDVTHTVPSSDRTSDY